MAAAAAAGVPAAGDAGLVAHLLRVFAQQPLGEQWPRTPPAAVAAAQLPVEAARELVSCPR